MQKNKLTIAVCGLLNTLVLIPNVSAVSAQTIIPDATVGTAVTPLGPNLIITGGTPGGSNLFHSFQKFSLNVGNRAIFNVGATPNVNTIFSRITGRDPSNINGLIAVTGNTTPVNLFLMNPNGIIFGPNAQLSIGGSFVATTASGIKFANESTFASTATSLPTPLLTVSLPVGLQMGRDSGSIQVNGNGNDGIVPTSNLGIVGSLGRSLTLVGNGVNLNGGVITMPSGRLEIGSVGGGEVKLIPTATGLKLGYEAIQDFRDITFSNRSSLWNPALVTNPNAGIQIVGRAIQLDQSQIAAAAIGSGRSGDITLRASQSLEMGGFNANASAPSAWIVNQVSPGATANSGAVNIQAPNLTLRDGAAIQTLSLGSGNAGQVQVSSDTISAIGSRPVLSPLLPLKFSESRISSDLYSKGNGGNITVSARQINLNDGGTIGTTVYPGATGRGGDITVSATDNILAEGVVKEFPSRGSGIQTLTLGVSNSGNLAIETGDLSLLNGATTSTIAFSLPGLPALGSAGNLKVTSKGQVRVIGVSPDGKASSFLGSSTLGFGNAGDVEIAASSLLVGNRASVTSNTLGSPSLVGTLGNSGNLTLRADQVELNGASLGTFTFSSGNAKDALIQTQQLIVQNGGILSTVTASSGNAGNLTVRANDILVSGISDQFETFIGSNAPILDFGTRRAFNLPNLPTGNTGKLSIQTDRLTLQNRGQLSVRHSGTGNAGELNIQANTVNLNNGLITASTVSGQGGNLSLAVRDLLTLRRGSEISAESGGSGNGGNATIDARFIVAMGNSDIVANAFRGNGGNIKITTQGIFGLEFRPQRTSQNDITASSQFGVNGTVQVTTLNIDPSKGLTELPVNLTDSSQQISKNCGPVNGSSFVSTGRGGIPIKRIGDVKSHRTWNDTRASSNLVGHSTIPNALTLSSPIVEATVMKRTDDGVITLIATTPSTPLSQGETCGKAIE